MNSPDVSIVIPSTGSLNNLYRILASIEKQNLDSLRVEINIIINGLSKPEIKKLDLISKKYPKVNLFILEEKNASAARNYGILISKSKFLLFLDDDSELISSNIILTYLKVILSMPNDVLAVGGGYVCPPKAKFFDKVYNYIQMNWFLSGRINPQGDSDYLLGGNFLLNKNLLNPSIVFSDKISYGGSENYFFTSARAQKKILRQVSLDVLHHTNESFLKIIKKTFKQGRGQAIVEIAFADSYETKFIFDEKETYSNEVVHNKYSHEPPFIFLPFLILFRYSYWWGYFNYKKKYVEYILFICKNIFRFLNAIRFKIIDKLKKD
jgi:glycosyltransferase involved in cell wall biosynthesis